MHVRRGEERGQADFGWLKSAHTFSFGGYHDPRHMGFGVLRVINDDRVAPRGGFPTHPHRDMEIISYVVEGELAHRDTLGNGSVIRPGEVQRMSAGTGVTHSEKNASGTEPVHFLQIWFLPAKRGLPPGYEQKRFADAEKDGRLRLVASPDGRDGSVTIHSDGSLYAGVFRAAQSAEHPIEKGRHAWVHVARGNVRVNGETLGEGDAISLSDEPAVRIEGIDEGEVLVFDLG